MANEQLPHIRVLGFKTTYEMLPVKGDPLNDEVDRMGYKLDAKGNRVRTMQEEHWVTYSPAHSPLNTINTERVRHMIPDSSRIREDQNGEKTRFLTHRWSQIEPAYEAFKSGRDVPINGTPLAAWPGVMSEQAEVLRRSGIRTVEEVRDLTDGQIDKVHLPNVRELRRQAGLFLENSVAAQAAEREAQKDALIEEMAERLASLEALLDEKTEPRRGRKPKLEEAAE